MLARRSANYLWIWGLGTQAENIQAKLQKLVLGKAIELKAGCLLEILKRRNVMWIEHIFLNVITK